MIAALAWLALAQEPDVLPVPDGQIEEPRRLFRAEVYEALDKYREVLDQEKEGHRATEEELQATQARLQELLRAKAAEDGLVEERPETPTPRASAPTRTRPQIGDVVGAPPLPSAGALVFAAPDVPIETTRTVLPAGSYVKVRILTGVEASDRDKVPMALQADYAAVGPNHTRVDLSGCLLIAEAKADLATDRVFARAVTLSCVRDDGEHVDREINGYLAGEDSTFGVTGKLISRQGRVLAAATVASLAQGAGEAVATAQRTQTVVSSPLGGTGQVAENVTGSQLAYVGGSSVAGAAERISDWYLGYATKLTPAIAVGSGRDVWVVLLETVELPSLRATR